MSVMTFVVEMSAIAVMFCVITLYVQVLKAELDRQNRKECLTFSSHVPEKKKRTVLGSYYIEAICMLL